MKLHQFEGKKVYLVGGSTGIGLSIGRKLASAGADVQLLARGEKALQSAVSDLDQVRKHSRQRIAYRTLDVTDAPQVEATMAELVNTFGVPDALINCAGRAIPKYFEEVSYEQFDQTMKINLYGCRNTIAALLPYMKAKGGHIVNTSSIAGTIGVFGYTDYSASKFALIGFSESLRSELKKYNIKVSVLCPPDTDTPGYQNENLTKPSETQAISESASLMTPDQVADVFFKELPGKRMLIIPGAAGKFSVTMKRLFPRLVEYVMDRDIKKVGK